MNEHSLHWNCTTCTFLNESGSICSICGANKYTWNCNICTFANKSQSKSCEMCGQQQPNQIKWICSFCTFENHTEYEVCLGCGNQNKSKQTEHKHICNEKSIAKHQQMMNDVNIEIDLQSFGQDNSCENFDTKNEQANPMETCNALKRIHQSLIYYDKLNIFSNNQHKTLFEHFVLQVYYNIINDYIHFNNEHGHQLEQINKQLPLCSIKQCQYTGRHHETNNDQNEGVLNPTLIFYKQTLDALHFHLFHCFDVGIRVKKGKTEEDEKQDEKEGEKSEYFDSAFARLNKMILERQHITKEFDRFSLKKNNKFNIQAEDEQIQDENDDDTFLDSIYIYLQNDNNSENDLKKLNAFITQEEYESECIEYDVNIYKTYGNIEQAVNTKCKEGIEDF
eukprot:427146_1